MAHRLSLAFFVSGILVASCFVAPAAAATAGTTTSAVLGSIASSEDNLVDSDSALTAASASAIAEQYDHPVIIDSETTERVKVAALPDGSMQLTTSVKPVRVLEGAEWLDVDSTLEVSDGFVSPKVTKVPVRFSAGGDNALAAIQTPNGEWISETWPYGVLPTPMLQGDTATYEDVLPDIDLVLQADVGGMSEVLVVHNEAAAQNPLLDEVTLGITGADVSQSDDGAISAATPDGSLLTAAAPTWWDSTNPQSGPSGPVGNDFANPLDHTVDEDSLSLNTESVTSTEDVTYPLYVDPDWTYDAIHYWYVDQAYPTQSYLDGANAQGSQKVGYLHSSEAVDGRTHKARTFYRMELSDLLDNATVIEAEFRVTELWSFSCTKSTVNLWRVGSLSAGSTWDETSSSVWADNISGLSVAKGYNSNCPAARIGFDAATAAQWAADNEPSFINLGLRAADETNNNGWKRFDDDAELSVKYNHTPKAPTGPIFTLPARACSTSATNPVGVFGGGDIAVRTTTDDVDDQTLTTTFHINNLSTGITTTHVSSNRAQGATSFSFDPGFFAEGNYSIRARSTDGVVAGAYSPLCYFNVDSTPPSLPGVTALTAQNITGLAGLPAECDAVAPSTGLIVPRIIGKPMCVRFSKTGTEAIYGFEYWWSYVADDGNAQAPAFDNTVLGALPATGAAIGKSRFVRAIDGENATVLVAPVASGATLWVASYDIAGNVSTSGDQDEDGSDDGIASATALSVLSEDDPAVSYNSGAGHGWTTNGAGSTLPASLLDKNTSNPASLSLGGVSRTNSSTGISFPGDGFKEVYRYTNNSGYLITDSKQSAPWAAPFSLGLFADGTGALSGTLAIYSCALKPISGNDMGSYTFLYNEASTTPVKCTTSIYIDPATQPIKLGYTWTSASSVPAGKEAVEIFQCRDDVQFFVNFSATCSGHTVVSSRGFVAKPPAASSPHQIDISESFTVMAQVVTPEASMLMPGRPYVAVSQSGATGSNFTFGISVDRKWQFCVTPEGATSTPSCVETDDTVVDDTAVRVTGIQDVVNGQLRILYGQTLNPQSISVRKLAVNESTGTGPILIGTRNPGPGGNVPQQWRGKIRSVSVFQGVSGQQQLTNFFNGN